MVAIACAWESIVGGELAQKARPLRLDGVTLHVVTASGAWSQQLAFLESQILSALRRLPEIKNVERLRFRVGRLRVRSATEQSKPSPPEALRVRPREDMPAGMNPLERFRLRCARGRREARAVCDACGVPMQGGESRCAPCVYARRRERSEQVQRIMYETPWLTRQDISVQVGGLAREEYEEIRRGLLRRWLEILERVERTGKLRSDGFERRIAGSYILLQSGLAPDRISQAAARNLLGKRLEALLFGPPTSSPPRP
jgi:hypothetical protein